MSLLFVVVIVAVCFVLLTVWCCWCVERGFRVLLLLVVVLSSLLLLLLLRLLFVTLSGEAGVAGFTRAVILCLGHCRWCRQRCCHSRWCFVCQLLLSAAVVASFVGAAVDFSGDRSMVMPPLVEFV